MGNSQIAEIFYKIADILEIQGENPFRIRAYRKAAQTIESLNEGISQHFEDYDLFKLSELDERRQESVSKTGK